MATNKTQNFLFTELEKLQGDIPWGSVLDAGTGNNSIEWILDLDTTNWTAITGAEGMRKQILPSIDNRQRSQDRLIVGNWIDKDLLAGEKYDTVVADYLLGAIDGFAPYWQESLFTRLRPLVGKRLYIIGQHPYVPHFASDIDGRLIGDIGRLRDACLLLAGERPYREYPLDWVIRQLKIANYNILHSKQYAIRYSARFVNAQLNMCVQRCNSFSNSELATQMLKQVEKIRQHALNHIQIHGGIRHGHDYIVVAQPNKANGKQ